MLQHLERNPTFPLEPRKVLDTLEATPEVSQHSCLHLGEPRQSRHNSRKAPFFHLQLEIKFHFTASLGKESRHYHHTSRGGGPYLKVKKNSRGPTTIPKTPMSQSTPDTPGSPALTRLSPRVLTLNTIALMIAFEISRQSHRFLSQLDRKLDTTVTA